MKIFFRYLLLFILSIPPVWASKLPPHTFDNQTDTLSSVLPSTNLPFQIVIEQLFQLPVGFQSGAIGKYKGLWILIAGRINGLHGFTNDGEINFPPSQQNTSIFVVNPATGAVSSRSLLDPSSGLTEQQIDTLSVVSPQSYQEADTLFITGGYGIDTNSGTFTTKPVLTALYLPGLVDWVLNPSNKNNSVVKNMLQLTNPLFQITGGEMYKLGDVTQLLFGQDFEGPYTGGSNGNYSEQVRRFRIKKLNNQLAVDILSSMPSTPDPNFRRRDLNVLPALLNNNNQLQYGLIAYAGVFTLTGGVWTVPVLINGVNDPVMANPNASTTFKQAMNQYDCASTSLYSRKFESMYHIFFGGISFGFFNNGSFTTDDEIPFINDVTTIQMDKNGNFTQYLMNNTYPVIISTGPNPGNIMLFGASARFISNNVTEYANGVISLDSIRSPTVIGYIVGGIQSTIPNTSDPLIETMGSPYVFKVTLYPQSMRETAGKPSKPTSYARVKQLLKPDHRDVKIG